jgi:hypothetical protein
VPKRSPKKLSPILKGLATDRPPARCQTCWNVSRRRAVRSAARLSLGSLRRPLREANRDAAQSLSEPPLKCHSLTDRA